MAKIRLSPEAITTGWLRDDDDDDDGTAACARNFEPVPFYRSLQYVLMTQLQGAPSFPDSARPL